MHSATELLLVSVFIYLEIVSNCMINLSFQQSMKKGLT